MTHTRIAPIPVRSRMDAMKYSPLEKVRAQINFKSPPGRLFFESFDEISSTVVVMSRQIILGRISVPLRNPVNMRVTGTKSGISRFL
jgi:hypothetical protein